MATLEFWELAGYPQEDLTLKKFTATRKLLVAWENRDLLRFSLIRHPGAVYPYINDWSIRCTGVAVEPFGGMTGAGVLPELADYDWAVVTARYESPDYGAPQAYPASDPVKHADITKSLSESLEPNVEAMKLPYEKFVWSSDGAPIKASECPFTYVHRMSYVLTRHYQVSVPEEAVTFVGKISSEQMSPVMMPAVVFPAKTLKFEPPSIDLSTDPDGNTRYDVTYRFQYKEEGWDKFYRADTQAYDTIRPSAGGGAWTPGTADFRTLQP